MRESDKKLLELSKEELIGLIAATEEKFAESNVTAAELVVQIEEKNEELNAASIDLSRTNKDLNTILQNLGQGIFVILPDYSIHPQFSGHLKTLWQTGDIAGRYYKDLLFHNCTLSADQVQLISSVIESTLGEDEASYLFNSDHLPRSLLFMVDGQEKIFDVDWVPIVEDDIIVKLMVILKNVTDLKRLEREAGVKDRKLEMMGQIVAVSVDRFQRFCSTQQELVANSAAILSETLTKQAIDGIFIDIHTLKGNSRIYNFTFLADKAHIMEDHLNKIRSDHDYSSDATDRLQMLLYDIQEQFAEYQSIYYEIFHTSINDHESMESRDGLEGCFSLLSAVDLAKVEQGAVKEILESLQQHAFRKFQSIFDTIVGTLPSLAEELGKPTPTLHIQNQGSILPEKFKPVLKNVFMHCIRNSLDHGIEKIEERRATGKTDTGNIYVYLTETRDHFVIEYFDDGRGLHLGGLRQRFESLDDHDQEIPSEPEKIADLVFFPGLSTAEKVTDISGYGVGLNAVKNLLLESDCAIGIELGDSQNKESFVNFKFVISLPKTGIPTKAAS